MGRTCRRVPSQTAGTQTNMHATLSSSRSFMFNPTPSILSFMRMSSSFGWLQAAKKLARDCELQQGASWLSLAAVQAQGCFCFLALLDNARNQAQHTSLTAEEEKISSLRLKETLAEKDEELQSIARENDGLRTREAAARAKADELAAMLVEATAMKGGDQSAGRSPEKQPNVFRKMMCSPMDNVARGDHEARRNSDRIVQVLEEIKHVEVETVRHVKHEREVSVEVNSMENSKIIEDDLCKGMLSNGVDTESSEDDDIDSQGEDGAADQTGGLLMHGPRSSFKQEHHSHKKKKALLRKFGSMLKKKAHFTKLNKHS